MDKTDIAQVKETSILLLRTDLKLCDGLPPELHVYHPFFTSSVMNIDGEMVDILKDKTAYGRAIALKTHMIDRAADLSSIFIMVNDPYKLTWYKYVSDYLGDADRAKFLADAWTTEENPNMDPNCPISYIIKEFRKCKKEYLMRPKDLAVYNALPDEFPIYRGVSVGRSPKGISYTRNLEKARWFAHRFDNKNQQGYILSAKGSKDKVLAYLNTRGEDELVYDTRKLVTSRLEES